MNSRKARRYVVTGYGPGLLDLIESSYDLRFILCRGQDGFTKGRQLVSLASVVDRYFRSGVWWVDRLAMALGTFWNAICAHSNDLAFTALTTVLETLLSTQKIELNHIIAERAAAMTKRSVPDRLAVYRLSKSLYGLRSSLVHGSAFPKKGKQLSDSTLISAKNCTVSYPRLGELVDLTRSVILSCVRDREYRAIVQARKNEDKIGQELDQLFLRRLFRG